MPIFFFFVSQLYISKFSHNVKELNKFICLIKILVQSKSELNQSVNFEFGKNVIQWFGLRFEKLYCKLWFGLIFTKNRTKLICVHTYLE